MLEIPRGRIRQRVSRKQTDNRGRRKKDEREKGSLSHSFIISVRAHHSHLTTRSTAPVFCNWNRWQVTYQTWFCSVTFGLFLRFSKFMWQCHWIHATERLSALDNTMYLRLCRWWSIWLLDKQLALLCPLRYHGAAAHGHDPHTMSWRTLLGQRSLQTLQKNNDMTSAHSNSTTSVMYV